MNGFRVLDESAGVVRRGDLYYYDTIDMFQVRGAAPVTMEPTEPFDAIAPRAVFSERKGSKYWDSEIGIEFSMVSAELLDDLRKWYPQLEERIQRGIHEE